MHFLLTAFRRLKKTKAFPAINLPGFFVRIDFSIRLGRELPMHILIALANPVQSLRHE